MKRMRAVEDLFPSLVGLGVLVLVLLVLAAGCARAQARGLRRPQQPPRWAAVQP